MEEHAVEQLIQALKDDVWDVRLRAAEALGKIGQPVLKQLVRALHDEHVFVRRGAVTALGIIGGAPVIEPLIQALTDTDDEVRETPSKHSV
jgi:HEAT repeat protein